MTRNELYPDIVKSVETLDYSSISQDRKETLQPLADFIQSKVDNSDDILLNFICTHNSRKKPSFSGMGASSGHSLWNKNVTCYSGGTDATAMFPLVGQTLEKAGFKLKAISPGNNPVYTIKYSENEQPIIAFSKTYYDDFNPETGFAAIMTCSHADGGCPFISGAEKRVPITFDDPKEFDGTPQQAEKYEERSHQIATEMFYVFSQIK